MNKEKKFSGYLVALGATLVLFVHNGIMGTLGLFLPEFASGLNASITAVSLGLTVSSIVAFLISLFVGRLIVRFSPKYMLLLGSITCCIQCIVYGSATSVYILYLAAIIEGITTGIATTTCISAVVKDWFVEKREAVIGYVIGGAMIGSALYNLLAGVFISSIGWRYAYYALAATALIIAIPANLIMIKKSPAAVGQKALGWEKEAELEAQLASSEGGAGISASEAGKSLSFWLILIFGGLFAGMSMGFITYAPSYWQELGMDALVSSRYFTVFSLLAVVATMLSGKVSEKFGNIVFIAYLHIAYIIGLKQFDMTEFEATKKKYAAEVKERWGNTAAYNESEKKTSSYDDNQWKALSGQGEAILQEFGENRNIQPQSTEAQALVKKWQDYITANFYNCTKEILSCLGLMYIGDERFTQNIDQNGEGTAAFMAAAIEVFCSK